MVHTIRSNEKEMRIYQGNGQTRHALDMMHNKDLGMMVSGQYRNVAGKVPYYSLDNGCFGAKVNGYAWDESLFLRTLNKYRGAAPAPDFVVCPDIPFEGIRSLEFSRSWLKKLPDIGTNYYLAVQDGMTIEDVDKVLCEGFGGIFVGGSLLWKYRTSEEWVRLAHAHGLKCHIGRVAGYSRIKWALTIGADSIDSTSFSRHDRYHHIDWARESVEKQSKIEVL